MDIDEAGLGDTLIGKEDLTKGNTQIVGHDETGLPAQSSDDLPDPLNWHLSLKVSAVLEVAPV